MKICFITPRYSIAGVALAQVRSAKAWLAAGHQVDLIIGYVEPDLVLPAIAGVRVTVLDTPRVVQMVLPIARYLRCERPDVVFSAEDHLNGAVLVAAILARSKAMISGSSRVPPKDSYSNTPLSRGWFRKLMMRGVMWRADALTCVSEDMVQSYRHYFPHAPHKAVYNIINDATAQARSREPVDHEWFIRRDVPIVVAAGTLTGRKNFRLLIDAMGEISRRGRHIRLAIFGEGYRRPELEAQVVEYNIADRVWMPGRTSNPLKYFANADVIALSSYAEGLPNVLIEGMVCGCTPVATDCPTGPREVIEGGGVGYLVGIDDVQGLADAIECAVDTPADPTALAAAVAPFSEEAVMRRHLEVLGLAPGSHLRQEQAR